VSLVLRRPNPLAYPAGCGVQPGVAPQSGATFSAIAAPNGANFLSLLNGAKPGTVGGTSITSSFDPLLGPVTTLPSSTTSATAGFTFAGNSSTAFAASTICAIFRLTAITTNQYIFSNGSGSMVVNSDGSLRWVIINVADEFSGQNLTAGVPYFVAQSQLSATSIVFLTKRLDTGKIVTSSSGAGTPGTGATSWVVGNSTNNNQPTNGSIAAVLFSPNPTPVMQLFAWAQDPWSLWYPNSLDLTMMLKAPSASPPPSVRGLALPRRIFVRR
jgi:hypothetical protein